jgi:hypothetical protein
MEVLAVDEVLGRGKKVVVLSLGRDDSLCLVVRMIWPWERLVLATASFS